MRRLVLRREALAELTSAELGAVAAGGVTVPGPLRRAVAELLVVATGLTPPPPTNGC